MWRGRALRVPGDGPGHHTRLIDQHRALVAGIRAGDAPRAEGAIRTHLRGILDDLPVIRADCPDYFT